MFKIICCGCMLIFFACIFYYNNKKGGEAYKPRHQERTYDHADWCEEITTTEDGQCVQVVEPELM